MVCQEPLEHAVLSYESSAKFAAVEAERVAVRGGRAGSRSGRNGRRKAREREMERSDTGSKVVLASMRCVYQICSGVPIDGVILLEGNKESVSGERRVHRRSGEAAEEVEPSTPLLTKARSSRDK